MMSLFESRTITKLLLVSLLAALIPITAAKSTQTKNESSMLPIDQLKALAATYWQIKESYVDQVDDKRLFEGAIDGMLKSLDPYSGYLSETDLLDLQSTSDGSYDGLGIEVTIKEKNITVVNVLKDSPADRAGILFNDVIVNIDDALVAEVGAEIALESMRGQAGEAISLVIERKGNESPIQLNLVREKLELKSVEVAALENELWLIKLTLFQRDSAIEMDRAFRAAVGKKHVKGLVLDLRDNPGGVLHAAVDVADLILSGGEIVSTEGRSDDAKHRYFANPGDIFEQLPVVVLINEGSASASEIVAGALQDHKRAKIIGTKSFGKGVVQSILPLQRNSAIKLTTSRYLTPHGRNINGVGITPDLEVASSLSDEEFATREIRDVKHDKPLQEAIMLLASEQNSKL